MEKIRSLAQTGFDELFAAFREAFKDYDIQLHKHELEIMLSRRGFVPELSFGAFYNERLVSFTLNGIGTFNGICTAYDTGTGTVEAFRGKGLASHIFQHSIPELKNAGIRQYLLEVLQHNTKAVSVYQKMGFKVNREFNYFVEKAENIRPRPAGLPDGYQLRPVGLELKEQMSALHDFVPSWQNSFESVARRMNDFVIRGVFAENTLIGYCIFEPDSGDITQLAVAQAHRNRGIAACLIREAISINKHPNLKLINTDVSQEDVTRWAASIGLTLRGQQFEMSREI